MVVSCVTSQPEHHRDHIPTKSSTAATHPCSTTNDILDSWSKFGFGGFFLRVSMLSSLVMSLWYTIHLHLNPYQQDSSPLRPSLNPRTTLPTPRNTPPLCNPTEPPPQSIPHQKDPCNNKYRHSNGPKVSLAMMDSRKLCKIHSKISR